jgi:ABC-type antimicrobial peptide transport system permease subunit
MLTLCLAVAGVYAVVAYEAKRQTREIGIRMALGANGSSVVGYVIRAFLLLSCAGIGAGVLVSLVFARWMSSMLYGIRPNDPATFGLAAIALIAATLLGALLPAYRASRINPAVALRAD